MSTPPPAHRTPGLPDDSTPDAFAARLKELFTAAGNPTLASTANTVGGKVTVGALSHWRTGRHLPAQFSTIEPVLAWLTDRAYRQPTATAADAHAAQIWPIRAWAAYFERVTTTDPHRRSVLNTLAAADMLGTSGERDETALASLAAQLTAMD